MRARPTILPFGVVLAGLALDGLAQDVEDFRHVWVLLGVAAGAQKVRTRTISTTEGGQV